jgi:uncharacterized protein
MDVETPHGLARIHLHGHLHGAERPRAALVLGHGAGGGVEAPDLVTARDVALAEGLTVALVEQPYRVAGKRSSPRAPQLDAAWLAVVEALRAGMLAGLPLVTGGRSAGARVACRTAAETGAAAVLCLAFPLVPPARRGSEPGTSRLPELDAVEVPVLVVQGERDRFGIPPAGPRRQVVVVPGDHSLRTGRPRIAEVIRGWLAETLTA